MRYLRVGNTIWPRVRDTFREVKPKLLVDEFFKGCRSNNGHFAFTVSPVTTVAPVTSDPQAPHPKVAGSMLYTVSYTRMVANGRNQCKPCYLNPARCTRKCGCSAQEPDWARSSRQGPRFDPGRRSFSILFRPQPALARGRLGLVVCHRSIFELHKTAPWRSRLV